MTRIISILNRKGGVGKTTTSINLGAGLARSGKRVLVVDNDPQANLTNGFGIELDEDQLTIFESYERGDPLPLIEISSNLFVVPSSGKLETIQNKIADDYNKNHKLLEALDPIKERFDYILIDCPPSLAVYTANALTSSTHYLVIAQSGSGFSNEGVDEVVNMIDNQVRKYVNKDLECLGILITFYDPQTKINRAVEEDLEGTYNSLVFERKIRQLTKLKEASYAGEDIFTYSPASEAAKDYRALTNEVLKRMEG